MKKKLHGHGERIVGVTDFGQTALDNSLAVVRTEGNVTVLIECLEDISAQRMLYVMAKPPIHITNGNIENIETIIRGNIPNNYVSSIICNSLRYYAGITTPVAQVDKSVKSCGSKDKYKSVKHAQQDCKRFAKYSFNKLAGCFAEPEDVNFIRLKSSTIAIDIFADYIFDLLIGTIPRRINVPTFTRINNRDTQIGDFYTYDSQQNDYVASDKNTLYKKLNILTATELFYIRKA